MIKVKVPATSANIGAGFDSLGVALGLYNYVWAEETDGGLQIDIKDETEAFIPKDERNLVYCSMKALFDRVGYKEKGLHLILENNIMVTRGLGSSSAGIIGGLLAANEISGNKLSNDELVDLATELEGHPDNVAPALLGGLTVSVADGRKVKYVKLDMPDDLIFAAFVPNFRLATKKSRSILPRIVTMRDAAYNLSRSSLFVASVMTGNYRNIRTAVGDRLHQRYRKKLIPHIDELFNMAYKEGALGVYLSGSGPTIISIVKNDNSLFYGRMSGYLNKKLSNWQLHMLPCDNTGATVCTE